MQHLFVLVFLHVGTRRIVVSPSTPNPDAAWVKEQADAFLAQLPGEQRDKFYVQHDRDTKFTAEFDATLRAAGGKVLKWPYRAPNTNAFVERVIQTLRVEALDHFLFFGQKHLDYFVSTFAGFYNERRPHQSKENLPLPVANGPPTEERPEPVASILLSEVRCETQLGGLLKHYYRRAA